MKETDTGMGSKLDELYNYPSLQTEESIGCKSGEVGSPGETEQSLIVEEMKIGVWGGTKVTRFAEQISSGEICTEKEHWKPARRPDPAQVFCVVISAYVWGKYQKLGKEPPKRIKGGKTIRAHKKLGRVPVPTNHSEKLR